MEPRWIWLPVSVYFGPDGKALGTQTLEGFGNYNATCRIMDLPIPCANHPTVVKVEGLTEDEIEKVLERYRMEDSGE